MLVRRARDRRPGFKVGEHPAEARVVALAGRAPAVSGERTFGVLVDALGAHVLDSRSSRSSSNGSVIVGVVTLADTLPLFVLPVSFPPAEHGRLWQPRCTLLTFASIRPLPWRFGWPMVRCPKFDFSCSQALTHYCQTVGPARHFRGLAPAVQFAGRRRRDVRNTARHAHPFPRACSPQRGAASRVAPFLRSATPAPDPHREGEFHPDRGPVRWRRRRRHAGAR